MCVVIHDMLFMNTITNIAYRYRSIQRNSKTSREQEEEEEEKKESEVKYGDEHVNSQ